MDNKEIIQTLFENVLNKGNLSLLDELIDKDYIEHNPAANTPAGIKGIKVKLIAFMNAFPDIEYILDDLICEGKTVAVRYHWTGTQKGKFLNTEPSDKKVNVRGMDFYRIKDGKISEHWHNIDELGLLQQLDIIEIS